MKTYPFNKEGVEGRRLFKLLDLQFNPGVLDTSKQGRSFETYAVPSVSQCRVNKASFLFPSNLTGFKRPQVRIESDVELAWGEFADDITTLEFTNGEELPLTYTQPLEDDTLKMLIDAGLYRDSQFEQLMSKLMSDELFDAEADMHISHLDVGEGGKQVPVMLVEPVNVVHNDVDPSERTNIADLLKRSARIAIELRKEGVDTNDLVVAQKPEQDREVFISDSFRDVITEHQEAEVERQADVDSGFVASSPLLDEEIDVTDKLAGTLGIDYTTEDDRIRTLKEREWTAEREVEPEPESAYDFNLEPDEDDELDADDDLTDARDISNAFDDDGLDDISNMVIEDDDDFLIEPDEEKDDDGLER